MGRPRHNFYCFISDAIGNFYFVENDSFGNPSVKYSGMPKPLKSNPRNFVGLSTEFGTNKKYFSLVRTVSYPLEFVEDGAAILRYFDYMVNGYNSIAYLTIVKYNPERGVYELHYKGRFDFNEKKDNPKTGYTINTVDFSAWATISKNDDITYQIDCSQSNPKAIKVLFDGITLLARYIFQPVISAMNFRSYGTYAVLPLILAATDGDSSGIITNQPELALFPELPKDYMENNQSAYVFKTAYDTTVNIKGSASLSVRHERTVGFGFYIVFYRSTDTLDIPALPLDRRLFFKSYYGLVNDQIISFDIDQTFNLVAGERIMYTILIQDYGAILGQEIEPILTPLLSNITFSTNTQIQPTTAYALRPLDLLQAIVDKASDGMFTVNSNYYTTNNKRVVTCGEALRQLPNAYIRTSLSDWFKSYDCLDFIAFRSIDGNLWVEPATDVYYEGANLFDLGEVDELQLQQASEYLYNEIRVGCRSQDYRRSSGRLEFNQTSKFTIPTVDIKNTLELISPYRVDGFGIEFIRLDYQGGNTQDNQGDTSTFIIDITDETESVSTAVENFVNIEVTNTPLSPIITSPLNNDWITYYSPQIKGRCEPLQLVKFYVDSVFDGSTTSDADGNFTYNIVAVLDPFLESMGVVINTGVHVIDATFTDELGTLTTITVNISSDTTAVSIDYPSPDESLYNNKPLIKGVAQFGTAVEVYLDGVLMATPNGTQSCVWEYQVTTPLLNGNHTLQANNQSLSFYVNSSTDVPIITSFFDGFPIVNNLPLVEGVAIPFTVVSLYLNYFAELAIGTGVADAFGNWAIQLVPLFRPGTLDILTPIPNGGNTISTDLEIKNTLIQTVGYKLNRPAYSSITGVTDNTVFNVELSPKRMLLARKPFFASTMFQQQSSAIKFQTADKNQSLSTTLAGVTVTENADVQASDLGSGLSNLFLPVIATFKTKVPSTFISLLNNFSAGGNIRFTYFGNEVYCLPIGTMKMDDITSEAQQWKLLLSPHNTFTSLLNLFKNGLSISSMTNALYYSDYNPIHFVKYNFTQNAKYNTVEINEDWFENRNARWVVNPDYIQKYQLTDLLTLQIITNGVSAVDLAIHQCSDGITIDTLAFIPVTPLPIPYPDVCWECLLDMSLYPLGQYFFTLVVEGDNVCISERIETYDTLENTILLECSNSTNLTGAMFNTGFKQILRVEGLVTKWKPLIEQITFKDEVGDNTMLHSVSSKKRTILIGDGSGLPDYLYLKVAAALLLNEVKIEGVDYVIEKDTKLEPTEIVEGYPMYHYSVEVEQANNNAGSTFPAGSTFELNGVTLVIDASAFGVGGSGVVEIAVSDE